MRVEVTGTVVDATGRPDNTPWTFNSLVLREGTFGEVITTKQRTVAPSAGALTVELQSGPCVVSYQGHTYYVTVPAQASVDLWDVIAAGVAYPPDTRTDVLASAVTQYVETARAQFRRDLPDRLLAETVVAKTVTITTGQVGTYTSIPSGVAACTFPAVDNKLSLVGTTSSKLAQVSTYDIYGPNWKTHPDGSVGTQGMYTSSFGVDFWVSNSQYVEFVTGTLDTNLCSYKLWVDGRPVTDLPVQTTWTNPSYNHIKLDLGDTAPHRVRLMLCFGGIARIFLQPTGTMWPAKHRGPRLYVLGDSLTQGTAMNTGRELGTWLPRFASMIGADDYWNGAISGTGPTTSTGGFPDFVTRATTEAAPSKGELIITGSFINSMGASQSQLEAAYNSIFDVLLAMPSNPYVIAYGATNALGGTGGSYATFDGWVKNVCAARNVAYISSYTGKVFAPNGAEVADMGQWITTANTSVIIGGDNAHPTDAGHKVMAARFYEAYRALLAAN
jgi:lysophospholipase L1-like esterase